MSDKKRRTTNAERPVFDNQIVMPAARRGLLDVWFMENLAHFAVQVIPEWRMHDTGSGAHGTFTVTHDIRP